MEVQRKRKFWALLVTVLFIFFLKGVLLMTRYGITANGRRCEQNATNSSNVTNVTNHEFILTTLVYGILSVLRFVEYCLLGKQFYSFLFVQNEVGCEHNVLLHFKKNSKVLLCMLLCMIPSFLLGLAIPAVGIYQEIEHTENLCYRHYYEVYIAYCVVNVFRYFSACCVRLMMISTTLVLTKHWGTDDHTSAGVTYVPPTREEEVLQDWKSVSTRFRKEYNAYTSIGSKARLMNDLYQTWFILPWVIYLIVCSLKSYSILRPWIANNDEDKTIPQIYHLLYIINQFITLLIPYLCATVINTYHHKYYKTRKNQLDMNKSSFARLLLIDKEERYDFTPRILGTSITINIGSSFYVIILLAGLFLSVVKSLV
jgi:heme/copper-type cytochrome/quinol oxidase subunit 2